MAMNRALFVVFISSLVLSSSPSFSVDAQEAASCPTSFSDGVVHNNNNNNNVSPVDEKAIRSKIEKDMRTIIAKTEDILKVTKEKFEAAPRESEVWKCLNVCIDVYQSAISLANKCINVSPSGSYGDLNNYVSSITTDAGTCDDECALSGVEDPDLKKFYAWVYEVIGQCISDLQPLNKPYKS